VKALRKNGKAKNDAAKRRQYLLPVERVNPVSGLCSLCLSCRACDQVVASQVMCSDLRLRGQTNLLVLSVPEDGDLNTFSAVLTLETSVARWQQEFRLGNCLVSSLPSHFLIQPLPFFF
jgi:hypothetical protein